MPRLSFFSAALLLFSCAPVGGAAGVAERTEVVVTHPSASPIAPHLTCEVTTATERATSRSHRAICSDIAYPFIPPASGDHYGIWADYRTYDAPVPWGFLVHSMEHGGVVLAYDPESVAASDIRAAYATLVAAHGIDPLCRLETWSNRIIVVPASDLATPIAALAWEHVYEASCLDMASLSAFVEAHYAHAPEDVCGAGADGSTSGWCS